MGNLFTKSVPSATPKGFKVILDTILEEMLKRADLIDLYSLADPERCKRYIVVAESALQKLFVKVQLQPRIGPDGTLMIQKLEGLQKKNPMANQQSKHCLELAFYFIRIFQIYAALILSIFDSDIPTQEVQSIMANAKTGHPSTLLLGEPGRGVPGFEAAKPTLFSRFGFRGGALEPAQSSQYRSFYLNEDVAGPYSILNLYLQRPTQGVESMKDMRFDKYDDMFIPQKALYDFEGGRPAARSTKSTLREAPPDIIYTLPKGDFNSVAQTVEAKLALQQRGTSLFVKLLGCKLRSLPNADPITIAAEMVYLSETAERPKSKPEDGLPGGLELPQLLEQLFKQAVKRLKPVSVSPIPFLQKFKLIAHLEGKDGVVQIKNTTIAIPNVKQLYSNDAKEIPIQYTGQQELEKGERKRNVSIVAALSIEKDKYIAGRNHTYSVTIHLDNLEVEPRELLERIRPDQKTASSTFSTGLSDEQAPTNARGQTVAVFLQTFFDKLLSGAYAGSSTGGVEFKKGVPQAYNSSTVPEALRVKNMWDALQTMKKTPIKSYCVARALQLLNVRAIQGTIDADTFSSACQIKFPYVEEHYVPAPGGSITKVLGIRELEHLFYDVIEQGSPKIAATEQYKQFMQAMKKTFEGTELAANEPLPHLNTIKDSAAASKCEGRPDARIPLPRPVANEVYKQAWALINRQQRHVSNVMALLFKMFDQRAVQEQKRLAFHPKFAAGGMPAVTRLAEEARELLVDYYTGCETLYKGGLDILAKGVPAAAAPVVPTT